MEKKKNLINIKSQNETHESSNEKGHEELSVINNENIAANEVGISITANP